MDKGLLNAATSTDDSPTSGYILTEITRSTIASYQACTQLIEFLNARLKKNNHNVKFKCLIIIKHVCRTGRSDFKKDMARNLDEIKACLQYKGPPDPLRGDEIYRRVHDAAKDALEALFDSQMPVTNSSVSSRIQGLGGGTEELISSAKPTQSSGSLSMLGNLSFRGDSAGAAYTSSEDGSLAYNRGTYNPSDMAGIGGKGSLSGIVSGGPGAYYGDISGVGNPNFKDPREELSFMQRVSALADTASDKLSYLTSSSSARAKFIPTSTSYPDYHAASNSAPRAPAVGAWGQPLPGASGLAAAAFANSSSQQNQQPAPAFSPPDSDGHVAGAGGIEPDLRQQGFGVGRAGAAASDGQYEQQMVVSLCEPGGMKAVPPEDKLTAFMSAAPTLSPDVVGGYLLDSLNGDSWQSRVKALLVIAALAKCKDCGGHSVWWKESRAGDLQAVAQGDSKASVRTQGLKTLHALGLSVDSLSSPAHTRQAQRTAASGRGSASSSPAGDNVSLIDFDDDVVGTVSTAPAPATAASTLIGPPSALPTAEPANREGGGLFVGMSVGVEGPPTHTQYSSVPAPVTAKDPSLQASPIDFLDSMDPDSAASDAQAEEGSSSGFSFISSSGGVNSVQEDTKSGMPMDQVRSVVSSGPMDLSSFEGMTMSSTAASIQAPFSAYDLSGLNMTMPCHPRGAPTQRHHPQRAPQPQGGQYMPYLPTAMGSPSPQVGVRKVIPDSSVAAGEGSSGFSFMSDAAPRAGAKSVDDVFSFVSDTMKSQPRHASRR